jgi:hypothetical protein
MERSLVEVALADIQSNLEVRLLGSPGHSLQVMLDQLPIVAWQGH